MLPSPRKIVPFTCGLALGLGACSDRGQGGDGTGTGSTSGTAASGGASWSGSGGVSGPETGGGLTSGGGGSAPTGGSSPGGSPVVGGQVGSGGSVGESGGSVGAGAAGTGGAGTGGAGVGGEPAAGPDWHGWTCPAGPHAERPFEAGAAAELVSGVPLDDGFNEGNLIILEGPVWYAEELYFSEIDGGPTFGGPGGPGNGGGGAAAGGGSGSATASGGDANGGSGGSGGSSGGVGGSGGGTEAGGTSGAGGQGPDPGPPPARLLKLASTGEVSVILPEAGSNGLAVDASGALTMCSHGSGSVAQVDPSSGSESPLVTAYMDSRFNSPNDLAFGRDGTLYFTDPSYQAPTPRPQSSTRVYRVPAGSTEAVPILEDRRQPNGIVLSLDGRILYVSGEDGVASYPVLADGAIGEGEPFATGVVSRSDGMGIDCAGNVYLTSGRDVVVAAPDGTEVVRLSLPDVGSVTNVAFGGPERDVIYVTALGSGRGGGAGLYRIPSAIPGMPY